MKDLEARIRELAHDLAEAQQRAARAEGSAERAGELLGIATQALKDANARILELTRDVSQMRREGFVPPPDPVRMGEDDEPLEPAVDQLITGLELDRHTDRRVRALARTALGKGASVEDVTKLVLEGEPLDLEA